MEEPLFIEEWNDFWFTIKFNETNKKFQIPFDSQRTIDNRHYVIFITLQGINLIARGLIVEIV